MGIGEDLVDFGGLQKLSVFFFSSKVWAVWSKERIWKSSQRICLNFGWLG